MYSLGSLSNRLALLRILCAKKFWGDFRSSDTLDFTMDGSLTVIIYCSAKIA